jgi:hypothetical protein
MIRNGISPLNLNRRSKLPQHSSPSYTQKYCFSRLLIAIVSLDAQLAVKFVVRQCGLGWQKKGGREKLVSVTRGRSELTSYDIMLVMMDVTPL